MGKKIKRILAILAVAVILGLYLVTLFCAIFVKQVTNTMFLISLVVTVMVPLLLYIVFWLGKLFRLGEQERNTMQNYKISKGFAEAAAFNKREKKLGEDKKQDGDAGI